MLHYLILQQPYKVGLVHLVMALRLPLYWLHTLLPHQPHYKFALDLQHLVMALHLPLTGSIHFCPTSPTTTSLLISSIWLWHFICHSPGSIHFCSTSPGDLSHQILMWRCPFFTVHITLADVTDQGLDGTFLLGCPIISHCRCYPVVS